MNKQLFYHQNWRRTEKSSKLSDCLVFWCSALIYRQLAVRQLSGNCLDGLLMRGSIRWQEFRWQELHVLAESRKQEYGYYNINLLGSRLVHFLPKWGKQRAQVGQARYPTWASTLPQLGRFCTLWPDHKLLSINHRLGTQRHHGITNGLGCFICDPYALGYNLTFPKGSNRLLCLWLQPPLVLPRRGDAGYSVSAIDWWCSLFRFCHRLVMQFTPFLS